LRPYQDNKSIGRSNRVLKKITLRRLTNIHDRRPYYQKGERGRFTKTNERGTPVVKRNRKNEICEAIAEIRKIMTSSSVKAVLLRESLEKQEKILLNDLYEEVKTKTRGATRTKTVAKKAENPNTLKRGGNDESS
jgi:hypothetical protein